MSTLQFTVENLQKSERLDLYTVAHHDISRSRLKNGTNRILINEKASKLSAKVKGGEQVFIEWDDPVPENILPEDIPLDILYEDNNVLVVNKPQGMVVHPASGNWTGTLVNALLFHNGQKGIVEQSQTTNIRRPGIVHRLDKDTSGTIITAKNPESEEFLQSRFASRKVYKEYIAIVKGMPPYKNGEIKTQIIRDPRNRKRFVATTETTAGKFAHTEYECLGVFTSNPKSHKDIVGKYSLLRLKLKTGRTHQIRVHLKFIGCPILGDPIYARTDPTFTDATLMLHSRVLGIRIPTGEKKFFVAKTPARFKKVLKILHEKYTKTQRPLNVEL